MAVHDDDKRVPSAHHPRVQLGIVLQYCVDAHHHRVHLGAQLVDIDSRLFAGDVLGVACPRGYFPVQAHGRFDQDKRPLDLHVFDELLVLFLYILFQDTGLDLDAPQLELLRTAHHGIRVHHPYNHFTDTGLDNALGTRRRLAPVRTGLQGDVQGGASCFFSSLVQGVDFGMGVAVFPVPALAHDAVPLDNNATHQWVGADVPLAFLGQLHGQFHVLLVGAHFNVGRIRLVI